MAKQKLNSAQIAALRADYEAWNAYDPESISADELAARHGISKQTLYTYRDKWLDEDRRKREASRDPNEVGGAGDAIVFLTIELAQARARIVELERQLELRDRRDGVAPAGV